MRAKAAERTALSRVGDTFDEPDIIDEEEYAAMQALKASKASYKANKEVHAASLERRHPRLPALSL